MNSLKCVSCGKLADSIIPDVCSDINSLPPNWSRVEVAEREKKDGPATIYDGYICPSCTIGIRVEYKLKRRK